jgi:hypothetical protein
MGFNRDHALIANLLHCLGNFFTDEMIAIGRNFTYLGDLFVRRDFLRVLLQIGDDRYAKPLNPVSTESEEGQTG